MLEYADGEWIRRDSALYGRGRGGVSAGRPGLARADPGGERSARCGARLAADHVGALAVMCGDALPVFASAADLARELPGLRREVRDLARGREVEIVAAGAHPYSEPTEQPLTGGDH